MAKESVADIISRVAAKHGTKIGSASDVADLVTGLSTGNMAVDYVTGIGGLPVGRICELYGPPSSGKTTTALQTAALLQKQIIAAGRDEFILMMDFEQALDIDYAEALGLDVNHPTFLLAQPTWLEQGADIAFELIATGKVRMSIWDSIAAMTPKAQLEDEFGSRTAAMNRARLVNALLQRLKGVLRETGSCAVFLNHLVESVEMSGRPGLPPKKDTPGGKGIKFYASLRLEYQQIMNIKGKFADGLTGGMTEGAVATKVKVTATKNKVGKPFRTAEVRSRFGVGFDNTWTALQVLIAHNKVKKDTAGWYRFRADRVPTLVHPEMTASPQGVPSIQGEHAVLDFADTHPAWRHEFEQLAAMIVTESGDAGLGAETPETLPSLVDA